MRLVVQHHPSRADVLQRLLQSLTPPGDLRDRVRALAPVEVVTDPEPGAKLRSPWRTYRACLEALGDGPGLVLQDDAVACPGFVDAAEAAVRARPGRLVAFFHGGVPSVRQQFAQAAARGDHFIEHVGHGWVPTVALYWPPGQAAAFLAWVDQRTRKELPRYWRADDGIVARWARATRRGCLLTVPCLVEHPDDTPSLIGARHKGGRNPYRVAALYVGDGAETWIQGLTAAPHRLQ